MKKHIFLCIFMRTISQCHVFIVFKNTIFDILSATHCQKQKITILILHTFFILDTHTSSTELNGFVAQTFKS